MTAAAAPLPRPVPVRTAAVGPRLRPLRALAGAAALALVLPGCAWVDEQFGTRTAAPAGPRIEVPPPPLVPPSGTGSATARTSPPAARGAARGRGVAAAPPPAPQPDSLPPPVPRPGQVFVSPPPTAAQREQAAIVAACRQQAEQVIVQRDRGQLMREDEQAARLGASASLNDTRFTSDRLGRVFARDRMVEDCVDANRPLIPGGAPAGR